MDSFRQRLLQVWGPNLHDPSQALRWIEAAVPNQIEEDVYLDFKRKTHENTSELEDPDKGNLARAISGFANTDGGIVIWGVAAHGSKYEPDVARELRPIRDLRAFVTRLNSMCGQAVTPPLAGIENRAVPCRDAQDIGYVITVVPKRRESLTQAEMGKECKGRFFLRSGSGFFPIPQSLLAEFFARRPMPQLALSLKFAANAKIEISEELVTAE